MTDEPTTEALEYLLEEMDEVRRAAFEMRMETDPAVAAVLKATADGVAGYALVTTPELPLAPAAQSGFADTVLAAVPAVAPRRARRWSAASWLWPVAAALLLGVNLWQYSLPSPPAQAVVEQVKTGRSGMPTATANPTSNDARTDSEIRSLSAEASLQTRMEAKAQRIQQQVERLRAENAELQRARVALLADRDLLTAQLTQVAKIGGGRISGLELVNPDRFARGERKGLLALLQPAGTVPVAGPVVMGQDGMSITVVGVSPPPVTGGTGSPTDSAAYAWSLFDGEENEGLINLHNLPTVPESDLLALWVKSEPDGEFRPVGEIPATLYGGSGTVFVTLDPEMPLPSQVLVTREKRGGLGEGPGATVVLQGP